MSEIKQMNIFEKMLKVSEEVGTVGKNLVVKLGSGGYKAVAEADVIYAVKPLEIKYRIFSYPVKHEVVESKELERETFRKDGSVKIVLDQFLRVRAIYRFVNVDKPDEYIDIEMLGDGVDSGDKTSGKAQTYADKYALLKGYKIPTGDDPDQEPSKEYGQKTPSAPTTPSPSRAKLEEQFMFLASDDEKEAAAKYYGGEVPQSIPLNALIKLVEKLTK